MCENVSSLLALYVRSRAAHLLRRGLGTGVNTHWVNEWTADHAREIFNDNGPLSLLRHKCRSRRWARVSPPPWANSFDVAAVSSSCCLLEPAEQAKRVCCGTHGSGWCRHGAFVQCVATSSGRWAANLVCRTNVARRGGMSAIGRQLLRDGSFTSMVLLGRVVVWWSSGVCRVAASSSIDILATPNLSINLRQHLVWQCSRSEPLAERHNIFNVCLTI